MASNTMPTTSNKLRILLIPLFSTSHMQPFAELAVCLAASNEDVETTIAVTPANVSIVQPLLDRGHNGAAVKIATYPFPTVDGLPKGVENMGKAATPDDSLRIMVAAISDTVTRPAQEMLIRRQSPDAIVTDMLFPWNTAIANELGVPCVAFNVVGAFPMLAIRHLADVIVGNDDAIVEVPRFPIPRIRIPRKELPEFLRKKSVVNLDWTNAFEADCFGLAMNTSSDLEKQYCEIYTREGYVKRAYFVGPLALRLRSASPSPPADSQKYIMDWLDSKPNHSVVYISFGSTAHVKDAQLDELSLGLETSGKFFLWVVRGKEEWTPPKGWEERVQDRGFIIRAWAPQTAILDHPAVGAFVTQCGWNSVLETVAAGVPVLTWPVLFEQFITERLVTEVLGIGERLWPDGAGLRSETFEEHELVPAQDVAHALKTFMFPGGPGDAARIKVKHLGVKVHAAVAPGGSSHRDMDRLVNDLMAAAKAT